MTRVLHYLPWGLRTPHPETDLELVQEHLLRGDTVRVLVCNASFASCDLSLERRLTLCVGCVHRRREGLGLLDPGPGRLEQGSVLNLTPADRAELAGIRTHFGSLEELAAFTFRGFDAGLAVLSSLASSLRNPRPQVDEHARTIRDLLLSACAVYLSTRNWIAQDAPDLAYVYNGRYSAHRAFFRACQAAGITCATHERGATLDKYALFPDVLPHDLAFLERRFRSSWRAAPAEDARRVGARFFEDRAKGIIYNFRSFTAGQHDGLPEPWVESSRKVAVFLSSEDEFVAIGPEWANPLYADQWAGLFAILRDLRDEPNLHVYVRCHPYSEFVQDDNFARLREVAAASARVTVIEPASPVSTYRLLLAADRIITFGSTVGIEATYWRKPSILAGMSEYRALGGTYNPSTHAELMDLLRADSLAPKDLEAALMYGYDMSVNGIPFKHFEPTGAGTGRFRGSELLGHERYMRLVDRVGHWRLLRRARAPIRNFSRALARSALVGPARAVSRWLRAASP